MARATFGSAFGRGCGRRLPRDVPSGGRAGTASARPGFSELPPRLEEMLGQDLHIGEDGHEVRVACPARDEMHVHVVGDTGAGDSPEVPAQVVALWAVDLSEG